MKIKWIHMIIILLLVLCMSLYACSSGPDYVGKWETDEGEQLELTEDGHIIYKPNLEIVINLVVFYSINPPALGTYEPFGEEYIKVFFDKVGNILRNMEIDTWKISVTGDSMVVVWSDDVYTQSYKKGK